MTARGGFLFTPSPEQPRPPARTQDAHPVCVVAPALSRAQLNGHQAPPHSLAQGALGNGSAHAGPGGQLVQGALAGSVRAGFGRDDGEYGGLACGEVGGEVRGHGA